MTDAIAVHGPRFSGKRALVTGGANGIGKATVQRLAAEGATVAMLDIAAEPLDALEVELVSNGGRVKGFVADIGSPQAVREVITRGAAWAGGLDLVANIAGINKRVDPFDVTEEDWDRIMDVNLKGTFFVAQA